MQHGKAEDAERVFAAPTEPPSPTEPIPNPGGPGPTEPRRKLKKRKDVGAPRPSGDRTAYPVVKRRLSVYDDA